MDASEQLGLRGVPAKARFWLLDHGSNRAERIGDGLARPWYRLSRWCYVKWEGDRRV